jgi:hypothetical protein
MDLAGVDLAGDVSGDGDDEIDIRGLTLLDNSSFFQEQSSFANWFDDDYGNNLPNDSTTLEDYSLTFTESTLNETTEADSSLHLSDRLSPHDACSIDENCSLPTTPRGEKDGWIYPPPPPSSSSDLKGSLSPESNSNEAFLLQIQAQAAPNRNLFPSSGNSLTNTPQRDPSPITSPFVPSCSLFHHTSRGIAFPPLPSQNQSVSLSPLLSYYPLMESSPVLPLSLSSFSSFLFQEDSSVINQQQHLQLHPSPLTLISPEHFPSLNEMDFSGISIFQRNSDLLKSSLEYALLLPSTLFALLFPDSSSEDGLILQELSMMGHCHVTHQELLHQDKWEHFLIFSSISLSDAQETDLMRSLTIALEIITAKCCTAHGPYDEPEDYSHLLESAEFLLAGTPIKGKERDSDQNDEDKDS